MNDARATRTATGPRIDATIGFLAASAYLVALALCMDRVSYDVWGAMVVGPALVVAGAYLLSRARRREADPWIGKLLVVAFVAKMLGTLVRYAVTFELYTGRADAGGYNGSGRRLAEAFWAGNWDRVYAIEVAEFTGTEVMRLLTGIAYIVTGPTKLGGFLVFSWLGFWGLYGFYRAFRIGFPEGDHRRYAVLLFFLPSLLYWPSSIGKEAWMLFTLGLAAWGVALVLRYRGRGYALLGLGLAGTAIVRPHVTLLVFVALFIAYLMRRRSWVASRSGLLGRIAGVGLMVLVGGLVLTRTADFFHLQELDREGVEQVLERTEVQSERRGSQFDAVRPKSPGEYPDAVLTVVFRPFPWEAGSAQALVASVEGTLLALLFVLSINRLVKLPRLLVTTPYLVFAVSYTLMFVFAFSSVGNFGIITRQRTQVFPMVLVLLALPAVSRARDGREHRRAREPEPAPLP
jgi:hypothetical protein